MFLADWIHPVFIHYEVPANELQSDVPFELYLFKGNPAAYVRPRRLHHATNAPLSRPEDGWQYASCLLGPVANNDFLNFRTYVRHNFETGIYFLTEWMNNRFCARLGPLTFGLRYHFAFLKYHNENGPKGLRGMVCEELNGYCFAYKAESRRTPLIPCPTGSLDEFLLERYTAFTSHGSKRRFFRIWHPPWRQQKIEISITDFQIVAAKWPWFTQARLAGGNYSPGALNVWMGRPHRIEM